MMILYGWRLPKRKKNEPEMKIPEEVLENTKPGEIGFGLYGAHANCTIGVIILSMIVENITSLSIDMFNQTSVHVQLSAKKEYIEQVTGSPLDLAEAKIWVTIEAE